MTSRKPHDSLLSDSHSDIFSLPSNAGVPEIKEDSIDGNTVVRIGTPDVNCKYPSPGTEHPAHSQIRITVRSDRSALQLDAFEQREKCMMDEAKEHNDMLEELFKVDKEYEYSLQAMYYRKRQVVEFLSRSATWQSLQKRIQSSSDQANAWH